MSAPFNTTTLEEAVPMSGVCPSHIAFKLSFDLESVLPTLTLTFLIPPQCSTRLIRGGFFLKSPETNSVFLRPHVRQRSLDILLYQVFQHHRTGFPSQGLRPFSSDVLTRSDEDRESVDRCQGWKERNEMRIIIDNAELNRTTRTGAGASSRGCSPAYHLPPFPAA